jgi:hypothetical protein
LIGRIGEFKAQTLGATIEDQFVLDEWGLERRLRPDQAASKIDDALSIWGGGKLWPTIRKQEFH